MKKILFVLKTPPPVHGSTIMNQYVYNSQLIRKSFMCDFFTLSFSKSTDQIGRNYLLKLGKFLLYVPALFKKLHLHKPDLVYFALSPIGPAFLKDALMVFIIKLHGKKIVFHLHGKGIQEQSTSSIFYKFLYRFIFKNEELICLSPRLVWDIRDVYAGTPHIVPNGIPISVGEDFKKKNSSGTVELLFLSNLVRSKGILDVIDAVPILLEKGTRNFILNVVGDSFDVTIPWLVDYLEEKKISDFVRVLGPKYGEEKRAILEKADILVFPTYYENETWGLVLLEAMEYGLSIISTNEGAIPDIVDDGEIGFIVDKRRPDQIAEKLHVLISDPVLRIKMGEAGRHKMLQEYTLEKLESNLKNTLAEIVTKS